MVVTLDHDVVPRDDRAWPRGAIVFSAVVLLACVATGVGVTLAAFDDGVLDGVIVAVAFVAAFATGYAIMATGMRSWVAGRPVDPRAQLWASLAVFVAFLIMTFVHGRAGVAVLAGLLGGLLLLNIRSIRRARANRAAVDEAEAAQQAARQAEAAREAARDTPRPEVTAPPAQTLVGSTVDQGLRHAAAVERKRTLAWLIALLIAVAAAGAFQAPEAVFAVMVVIGLLCLGWVARRFWAAWLAVRDFSRADTPPRRAFIVLLDDPAPRMMRPLLGVWSEPPSPHSGRLPKPERVYRCDEERVELQSHQGDAVVHEAWVDTGPRRFSKPRWVAADGGIVLPHRRALFGRWYLSALIGGERPGRPRPLTLPPPHTAPTPVTRVHLEAGSLVTATLLRLVLFAVVAVGTLLVGQ